tara:strand:+ start:1402 stop:2538 length:1137 start_codon:yes stop_codon:yes gene_type:complete
MLLGSGELGKEITIAAKRLGCKVIACDKYIGAPAMQVADAAEVFDMSSQSELLKTVEKHQPNLIVPEIEALAVEMLIEIEKKGFNVIPTARATSITMNRDKIRNLASNDLKIKTAKFAYASSKEELYEVIKNFSWPFIIKPVMSSSGKGQSLVKTKKDIEYSWKYALEGSRGNSKKVIIEEFINFDTEITLLTIKQKNGETLFCDPIGHVQYEGDYQSSWQPALINEKTLLNAKKIAKDVTDNLGGSGIFGVEFFICGNEVIFSELSPRPHDTGLVTLVSQNINEFELHLRAILGLPIPEITTKKFTASRVILSPNDLDTINYRGVEMALKETNTHLYIFGKPNAKKGRRMGVAIASDITLEKAISKADNAANNITIF